MTQTCYRHSNRETGVSCSNCERPICPECMTSTSVGMRCPECAGQKTQVRSGAGAFGSASDPIVTYVLIALNVLVFLATIAQGGDLGNGGGTLTGDLGLFGPYIDQKDEWYRLITGGFVHAGLIHIGFNMYILYFLGQLLEPAIGRLRFAAIYFTSLLAGSFGALLLSPDSLTVGASGAVYGLMAATIVVARDRGGQQVVEQIGLLLALNLGLGFVLSGISIGGHIGGLVGGGLAALAMVGIGRSGKSAATTAAQLGTMALIAVAAVAGSLWAAGQSSGLFG